MSDLNRRIAELLGWTAIRWLDELDEWAGNAPNPLSTLRVDGYAIVPDYEHDLNASMTVIRERWPRAAVELNDGDSVIYINISDAARGQYLACHIDESTVPDAERLARALLAALEAEQVVEHGGRVMSETRGTRFFLDVMAPPSAVPAVHPGDYGKDAKGVWWAKVPVAGYPAASLEDHDVVEHPDGSITVSPSILMPGHRGLPEWHGYLERGTWRPV